MDDLDRLQLNKPRKKVHLQHSNHYALQNYTSWRLKDFAAQTTLQFDVSWGFLRREFNFVNGNSHKRDLAMLLLE